MDSYDKQITLGMVAIALVAVGLVVYIAVTNVTPYNTPVTARVGDHLGTTGYAYTGIVSNTITFTVSHDILYYDLSSNIIIFPSSSGYKVCIHIISVGENTLTYEFIPYDVAVYLLSIHNNL